MDVPFYRHGLDSSYGDLVADVLRSPFLTSAGVGKAVENRLREFFDVPHAKLINSWTNGAVATLLALGVGPGDEVIVPAMTFIAGVNVVELVGARPVLVDVDPRTLLIDIEAVAGAVSSRTRAVIPVHLYGQMLDVAALRDAVGPDVAIVEDSAHCFEGDFNGERPGRYSQAAIFSFYATKNVTCGEGGAIITRSAELHERVSRTVLHGMSASAADRMHAGVYRHWDMERLGTKANMPDLLAALLPPQIETVGERLAIRQKLSRRYRDAFRNSPIRMPTVVDGAASAHHLFAIHVPPSRRDEALRLLNSNGIGTTVNYRAVHTMSYYREKYRYRPDDFPVAFEWGAGTLSLPLYPGLAAESQEYVIDVVLNQVVPLIES